MLHLNLLPPEEKENLRYAMQSRALVAVAGVSLAAIAVFIVLLLPAFFRISLQTADVLRALRIETEAQERTGIAAEIARIRAANHLAEAVLQERAGQRAVAPLIEAALGAVPPAVSLSRLRFKAEARELTMEGLSSSRAMLLSFINDLKGLPAVAGVSSPITNLIRETDIRFTITVTFR